MLAFPKVQYMKLTQCKIATADEFREGEGEDMSRLSNFIFAIAILNSSSLLLIKQRLQFQGFCADTGFLLSTQPLLRSHRKRKEAWIEYII